MKVIVNILITAAFGIAVGRYQGRRGVIFPFWYTLLCVALFVAGLYLLESALGLFDE
jgi:ABC-type glycerol-3-phosphate transport system permease component